MPTTPPALDWSGDRAALVAPPMAASPIPTFRRKWPVAVAVLILGIVFANLYMLNVGVFPPVDFLVYRYGSASFWSGDDVYAGNVFGEYLPDGLPFVYTPFAAALLTFTSAFPTHIAFTVWTIACVATVPWIIGLCLPRSLSKRLGIWIGLVVLSCCTSIISQHLVWGQINLFLAVLCLADFFRHANSRWTRFVPQGMLIGVAAGIKLTPGIFIPYLLITRQWRMAFSAVAGFAGTVAIGAILFPAMSGTYWLSCVWHLSSKVDLGTQFASAGNSSIQGAAAALGEWAIPASKVLVVIVAILCLMSAAAVFRSGQPMAAVLTVGLTATLISPVSWVHHWVYLIPALIVLWFRGKTKTRIFVAVAVLVLVLQGTFLGEYILRSGSVWLAPLGILLRESLILTSVAAIGMFFAQRRADPRLLLFPAEEALESGYSPPSIRGGYA
ncbi:glycosyltransferase 87 family protein [Arthrobacter sp. MA-N2]|uniref:glycosyltransferase 87 family protein n=1 Tax=Arthrobacter sp. MA-N2 TaxID=1101188 RepID=UPI0004B2CFB8|nr:glycosyltransferase 87 family protein [Arthrobacter sp. MA-N2]